MNDRMHPDQLTAAAPPGLDLTASTAAVRTLFDAAACSVAVVEEDEATLLFVASDGAGSAEIVGTRLPVSRGIAGWAAMSGQSIAVRDVQTDARFARDVAESTRYVPRSILAAPMFDSDGEVLGVMSVLDPGVDPPGGWGLAVLGTLASQVAALVVLGHATPAPTASPLEELGRRVMAAVEELGR